MPVFKNEPETKRVIFNIEMDLAQSLEDAKEASRELGKKLDADTAVNKALAKFLKKAWKHIEEEREARARAERNRLHIKPGPAGESDRSAAAPAVEKVFCECGRILENDEAVCECRTEKTGTDSGTGKS
jgi:vacuolar-type H+-ATPase subunit H